MQILDLSVERREKLGTSNSRRYRRAGMIPCVLYGRGQDNVMLLTAAEAFASVQKAHTALVRLLLGGEQQTAMIRDVSWDVFGEHVEHVDFFRVEPEDEVLIEVPLTFVGVPVGVSAGGSVQVVVPDLQLHCRADSIPSEIRVDISHLEVGDGIHVGEIDYPPHVRPARPEDELLVQVQEPRKAEPLPGEEEVAPEEAEAAEGEEKPEEGKPALEGASE